jgi:sodium-dependent dicarboxylate transporter 2/3/5
VALSRRLPLAVAVTGTLAVVLAPAPAGLSGPGKAAVATAVFAAVLWATGAIPLAVTALLVPVLLTVLGVFPEMEGALAGFADPVLFLLLSGFMLAAAMRARGLDRLVAYRVLAQAGTSPRRLVLATMAVTAGLSMVVSNTATAAMMIPVAVGLVGEVTDVVVVGEGGGIGTRRATADAGPGETAADGGTSGATGAAGGAERPPNLQVATVLGIAYAASLGGVGTLVGTPPNAVVVGQLRRLVDVRITFVEWLVVGLPMVAVTLPVAWYLLTVRLYPPEVEDVDGARRRAERRLADAGPLTTAQRRTAWVVAVTAVLWVLGGLGFLFEGLLPGPVYATLFGGPGPSLLGASGGEGVLYFVVVGLAAVPALVLSGAADWGELTDIDWATLLLLGGGLCLAEALVVTDAAEWAAGRTVDLLAGAPLLGVVLAVVALVVLLGELASNTAMAAILAPILVTVGPTYAGALGVAPTLAATFLAVAGAVAASYGFALPVATPPNAIAYGTGYVSRAHMLRAGTVLDLAVIALATLVLTGLMTLVWPGVLG